MIEISPCEKCLVEIDRLRATHVIGEAKLSLCYDCQSRLDSVIASRMLEGSGTWMVDKYGTRIIDLKDKTPVEMLAYSFKCTQIENILNGLRFEHALSPEKWDELRVKLMRGEPLDVEASK